MPSPIDHDAPAESTSDSGPQGDVRRPSNTMPTPLGAAEKIGAGPVGVAAWLFAALAALHVVATRVCWGDIPMQVDTGVWAYIGGRILDGALPYRDLWDQKPPGIFYVFAAVQALFGRDDDRAFLWLDAVVTAAVCLLVFLAARRLAASTTAAAGRSAAAPSDGPATAAAAFTALLLSIILGHRVLADWGCNVEKFVALFEAAALLALSRCIATEADTRRRANRASFAAGLCCGLAGLFKQTAVFLPVVISIAAVVIRRRGRGDSAPGRATTPSLRRLWLGVAIPWVPVLISLWAAGILDDFFRDVLAYDFRRVATLDERGSLLYIGHWTAAWGQLQFVFLLFGPALLCLLWQRAARRPSSLIGGAPITTRAASEEWPRLLRGIVAAQWLVTTIAFLLAPRGYGHYLLQAAPFMAITAAVWFAALLRRHAKAGWSAATALALVASIWPLVDHFQFTFDADSPYRSAYAAATRRQRALIDVIRRETAAGDDVLIWPPDQAASWYAGRRTPFEVSNMAIVYKGKMKQLTPPMEELLHRLERDRPALIVDWTPFAAAVPAASPRAEMELLVPRDGSNLLEEPNDAHPMPTGRALAPLKRWLRTNYGGQQRADGFVVYFRDRPWRDWRELVAGDLR